MADAHARDWDDPIENDGSGYNVLPAGIYAFTVKLPNDWRQRFGGGGKIPPCPMAVFDLELDGGALGKSTITENLKLVDILEFVIAAFFVSIGQRKKGERIKPDWSKLDGAKGIARIEVQSWDKRDGSGKGYANRVAEYMAPDTEIAHPSEAWVRPADAASSEPVAEDSAKPANAPF